MKVEQENPGFLLSNVSRLMLRAYEQKLAESSLTLAQARVLFKLSGNEGIRQVVLADLLDVQPITLARIIDQLEKDELVERRPDPEDRRAYLIYLRPAAATRLDAIKHYASVVNDIACKNLNKQQVNAIYPALQKMRDNLASHFANLP